MAFIKSFKDDVFLVFLDKPFQSFAPWQEKHLCPVVVLRKGTLRS